MDQQTVYLRTPNGDAAITQRTRIVQRNLRNVLDLVDGKRTVADIIRKFGDAAIAEAALADLERSGFVETQHARELRESGPPTIDPQRQAEDATGAKIERLRKETLGALDDEDITIMDPLDFPEAGIAGTTSPDGSWLPGSAPGGEDELADLAAAAPGPLPGKPVFAEDGASVGGQAGAGKAAAERARPRRNWVRLAAYTAVASLLLAAAVVWFFPFDYYLPRIELRVRSSIGEPVRFGTMHFTLTPGPGLEIEHVRVGEDAAMRIGKIFVAPEFGSLLSDSKILSEVVLDHVEVDAAALPRIPGWFHGNYFVARALRFDRTAVRLARTTVEGLGGTAVLDANGRIEELRFVDANGILSGTLRPDVSSYRITLNAGDWALPEYDWIKLQNFDATGILTASGLRLDQFDARAFDGIVSGSARLGWNDDGADFSADVKLKHVALASLVLPLRKDLLVAGDLTATLRMAGRAEQFGQLGRHLAVEGELAIERGVLSNFDFAEAVRARTPGPTRGGQTRFEKASASYRLDGDTWRIGNLAFESGLMHGSGSLAIGSGDVSGAIAVAFLGANQARALVNVTGRLPDPHLSAKR